VFDEVPVVLDVPCGDGDVVGQGDGSDPHVVDRSRSTALLGGASEPSSEVRDPQIDREDDDVAKPVGRSVQRRRFHRAISAPVASSPTVM